MKIHLIALSELEDPGSRQTTVCGANISVSGLQLDVRREDELCESCFGTTESKGLTGYATVYDLDDEVTENL